MSSREGKITEFCTITGASRSIADSLLTACNGSLEMAINMHMEGDIEPVAEAIDNKAGPSGGRKRKAAEAISIDDGGGDDDVREPIPQKRETLIQPGFEGYSIRAPHPNRGRVRSVFDGFRNFSNEARSYGNGDSRGSSSRSKKKTLEELFKPPLDLMFKGDWQTVRDAASTAKKWLLVNIQDAGEFQCQVLNRDVWSSEAVKTILAEHFIFWQQYKEFEEAQRYLTFYPVSEWPHVAILDPRTGERLVTWAKIPDSATFCDLISEFLTLHPTLDGNITLDSSKKQTENQDDDISIVDATEDEQIAAAIQASLADAKKPKLPTPKYDSDSELEIFSTDDEDSNLSSSKSGAKKTAPETNGNTETIDVESEPSKSEISSSENSQLSWQDYLGEEGGEKSSIIIRFPDGRKEKKDIPCSSKFLAISKFVVSEGFPLESYEIVTNYPRRVLTDMDLTQSLKDLGLFPRETIFVQQRM